MPPRRSKLIDDEAEASDADVSDGNGQDDMTGSLAEFVVHEEDDEVIEEGPQRKKAKLVERIVPERNYRQALRWVLTQQLPAKAKEEAVTQYREVVEWMEHLHQDEKISYAVGGLETAPTTGKFHVQMYIELPPRKKKSLVGVRKFFDYQDMPMPYAEEARGSYEQNKLYCLKEYQHSLDVKLEDQTWFEIGKHREENPGKREQLDWDLARKQCEMGQFDKVKSCIYMQYLNNCKMVHFEAKRNHADLTELTNYWFYGKPGTGKSRLAREVATEYQGVYFKDPQNKWFDQYAQEECVIFDDLEKDAKWQGHILKTVTDRYPLRVEIKGASTLIRPKCVIVTSNYRIEDIWDDTSLRQALRRRFRVLHVQDFKEALGMYKTVKVDESEPALDPASAVNFGFITLPAAPLAAVAGAPVYNQNGVHEVQEDGTWNNNPSVAAE